MNLEALTAYLVKASVVLALAWICCGALRRASAAVRHQVWASAIVAVLVLPLFVWVFPVWSVPVVTRTVTIQEPPKVERVVVQPMVYQSTAQPTRAAEIQQPIAQPFTMSPLAAIVAAWPLGAMLLLARLIWGLVQLGRLRRESVVVEQLPCGARLIESNKPDAMPLAWGWRKPCVLLPAGFREWEEERLNVVLAHELAHVKRDDWLMQIAAEAAKCMYWFHPLVWLAAARLNEESERAADDAVLAAGFEGPAYASHLLELTRVNQRNLDVAVLAIAGSSPLERRLTALLDTRLRRGALSRRTVVSTTIAVVAALVPFAAFMPAQETRQVFQSAPAAPQEKGPAAAPTAAGRPEELKGFSGSSSKYEISGTVIEPGVNHPVVDAEVTISTETREIGKPIVRTAIEKVRTDAQGGFRFHPDKPDTYIVNTTPKEGYIRGNGATLESWQEYITLTEAEPTAKLSFFQARAAEIIGTIVDDQTGEPLSGVRITAQPVPGARGGSQFYGGSDRVDGPVSDAQGRFTLTGLAPGRFYLQIPPVRAYSTRVTDKFTDEDANEIELDFDGYDFVQGVDMTGVIPVTTISGGSTSAGTVRARKIKYYRARVTVDGADCSSSEPVQVSHYTMNGNSQRLFGPYKVTCGKPFLLRLLRPGQSFVEVSQGQGATRRRATASLLVTDKNLDVPIVLGRGIDVHVLITMADGASREALDQGMSKITFSMSVVGGLNFADYMPTRTPSADGRLEALNQRPGSADIYVGGLPGGHYVQEIRYNGSPINGNVVTWNSGASAQNLVVVVDNRPATISGTVQSSGKGLGKAQVFLVKWPAQEDVFRSVTRATADGSGNFQFTTLAAGGYRLFAVAPEQARMIDVEPGVLVRALTRAQNVSLERSSALALTLEPQDLSR